jgi:hypothetical protein
MNEYGAKLARDRRIREWLREAYDAAAPHDRIVTEDVLMWGVYQGEGDTVPDPMALFCNAAEAHAYVAFKDGGCEGLTVLPCLVDAQTRDSTEVPE